MAYTPAGKKMIDAAKAHTDLNVFGLIEILLESSLITADCTAAANKIRKICNDEMLRCLRRYDRAIRDAGGGTRPR